MYRVTDNVAMEVVTIALMTDEYAYRLEMNPTAIDSPTVNANKRGHLISDDCLMFSDPKVIHQLIVDISNPTRGTLYIVQSSCWLEV